ncbi:unnamed protein product [Caenorhabditis sp. 36 PRJEB53466]|nr:unnamed protein product [Caenorhabditis sp. 36 PRJEB53466]
MNPKSRSRFSIRLYNQALKTSITNVDTFFAGIEGYRGAPKSFPENTDLLLTNNMDISQTLVMDQKRRGMRVAVWTVNDMAELLSSTDVTFPPTSSELLLVIVNNFGVRKSNIFGSPT